MVLEVLGWDVSAVRECGIGVKWCYHRMGEDNWCQRAWDQWQAVVGQDRVPHQVVTVTAKETGGTLTELEHHVAQLSLSYCDQYFLTHMPLLL